MNTIRTVLMIAALLCVSGSLAVVSGEEAPLISDPKVIVSAPNDKDIQHLSWPKIVRADNGNLVVAYSAGVGHNKGASGLAVSLSKDGGHTFSSPELLCYFPKDDDRYQDLGNVALGMGEDGVLILLAMAYREDQNNTILGWRSLDDGESWQRMDTSAIGSNKTGSVFGYVFAVPGKGMAVCGHYRKPKGDGIWISYSTDNGRSWGPPQTITDKQYYEPVFIHASGKLIGLVRENKARAYHQFESRNLGESWLFTERAIQGNNKAVHPSPFITVDPQNPSKLYALVSERAPVDQISLWEAPLETLQWKRRGLMVEGSGDWTYPWMTSLGGNEWYLVYYKGSTNTASIYGARITVP